MESEFLVAMFAIFSIFIALPWIVLNSLSRKRDAAIKAAGDPGMNSALISLADRLEKRLDAIETILDHEVPGWRRDVNRRNA